MNDNHAAEARIWRLNFLLATATLSAAGPALEALGLAGKEFFVLDGVEDHPFPAELAASLSMSKPNLAMRSQAETAARHHRAMPGMKDIPGSVTR